MNEFARNEPLEILRKTVNNNELTPLRLKEWRKTVAWIIDGVSYHWSSDGSRFVNSEAPADITLSCSSDLLARIANKACPFFIALWATGEIRFEGSFADAYKLGYLFLSDKRSRRIVFLAHCFLNINPRFPDGAAYEGACVPLIRTLLECGVGVVQMPCAEFECLGPEKELYGAVPSADLRKCFASLAEGVAESIRKYREAGFEIAAVIGMNPSPSCGVEITKGKETMLGEGRDVSEKKGSGVFIEELLKAAGKKGITGLPVFGFRRTLPGEAAIEERLRLLREKLTPSK